MFSINAPPAEVKGKAPAVKQEPAVKPEVKQEAKPVDGPVSKWTLVDYDDDSAAFPASMYGFSSPPFETPATCCLI